MKTARTAMAVACACLVTAAPAYASSLPGGVTPGTGAQSPSVTSPYSNGSSNSAAVPNSNGSNNGIAPSSNGSNNAIAPNSNGSNNAIAPNSNGSFNNAVAPNSNGSAAVPYSNGSNNAAAPYQNGSAPNAVAPYQNNGANTPYQTNPSPYGSSNPQNSGSAYGQTPYGQTPGSSNNQTPGGTLNGQTPGSNGQTPGTGGYNSQAPNAGYNGTYNSPGLGDNGTTGGAAGNAPSNSAGSQYGGSNSATPYGSDGYTGTPSGSAPFSGSPGGGIGSGVGGGMPAIGGARSAGGTTPDVKPDPVNGQRGYREAGSYNPGQDRPLLTATPVAGKIDVYYVNKGDSLWKISRKYMVELEAVIAANPALEDPDLIFPGDQIAVPLDSSQGYDIAAANTDPGDGSTKIRSNIVAGRYSGTLQDKIAAVEEEDLFALVNKEREKTGLTPLNLSKELSNIARLKADEMSLSGYFDHTSPVYGSPFEMLRSFGVTYKTAGENIAKGQKTAKAVMSAWMGSQGHKSNILNQRYNEIGVGYASNGKTSFWVQIFASR
ncbi:MAG: CAP domain-containing protein [Clostridiales bacterium]|nr:CAP domain-containing protein [Clostridiales bacterium]